MKVIIFSYVILALVIIIVIVNSLIISRNIDVILEKLRTIPDEASAKEDYKNLFDEYMDTQHFFAITVSHDDLTNIEGCFYEILGAAEANDDDALKIAKSRLIGSLSHLKRLSAINIDSILFKLNDAIRKTASYYPYTHSYA